MKGAEQESAGRGGVVGGEMAQQESILLSDKPDTLILIFWTHVVEGENQFLKAVLKPPMLMLQHACLCAHTNTHMGMHACVHTYEHACLCAHTSTHLRVHTHINARKRN